MGGEDMDIYGRAVPSSALQPCEPMTASFDALPDEVIVRIFKELDAHDFISCSLTCRLFHATIRDSVVLQYQIELAISGMHDTDCQQLAIADRLAQLKTVQHGWATLHFRQRHRLPYHQARVWELFGGVLAEGLPGPETRGLAFMELPSAVNVASGRTWHHLDLGVNIRDFAMDPAQDLLVLISRPVEVVLGPAQLSQEFLVHLRTMTCGEKHPFASYPVLCFTTDYRDANDFVIQIMDDFIAILFHTPFGSCADALFIWEWPTGQIVTNLKASFPRGKLASFSFLSPRHFVISRMSATFDDPTQGVPALDVYDFLTRRAEGSTNPQLERTYELPRLASGYFPVSMISRSDPSPSSFSQSFDSCDRPFYTTPTCHLLALSLDFTTLRQRHAWSCMLFVYHSSLLQGLESGSVREDVQVVPWEDWGPTETRLIRTDFNEPNWVCYVHGTRYVRLAPLDPTAMGMSPSHLHVLDFNPLAPRRACWNTSSGETMSSPSEDNSALGGGTPILVSEPTTIDPNPPQSVFANKVQTTLPYWQVKTRETFRYWAVMIDEDCLVGRHSEMMHPENNYMEILCI